MLDGTGIDYIANSYRVFGNNGTHALNSTVDSGTGATSAVLTALENASDHLPIVADFTVPEPSALLLLVLTAGGLSMTRSYRQAANRQHQQQQP